MQMQILERPEWSSLFLIQCADRDIRRGHFLPIRSCPRQAVVFRLQYLKMWTFLHRLLRPDRYARPLKDETRRRRR